MTEELEAFEDAVIAQAPPGAVVVGASISPDGKYGVALTLLPSARDYPMDDLFERVGDRWVDAGGGSGIGVSWSSMSEDGSKGVLRYGDEALLGAAKAWVAYEGQEVEVPVHQDHFLFVVRDTDYHEDPRLVRFE